MLAYPPAPLASPRETQPRATVGQLLLIIKNRTASAVQQRIFPTGKGEVGSAGKDSPRLGGYEGRRVQLILLLIQKAQEEGTGGRVGGSC